MICKDFLHLISMKFLIIAVLISLSIVHGEETYSDKYDGMDIDAVIANRRLFNAYLNCVLDQGRCTAEGKELKNHISDGLQTGCSKCTGPQRKAVKKVITYLIKNERASWNQLVNKYDPQRVYSNQHEDELRRIQG